MPNQLIIYTQITEGKGRWREGGRPHSCAHACTWKNGG